MDYDNRLTGTGVIKLQKFDSKEEFLAVIANIESFTMTATSLEPFTQYLQIHFASGDHCGIAQNLEEVIRLIESASKPK